MPFKCAIDKAQRLVVVTASDCFTAADLRAIQNQLRQDPDFNPEFDLLTDLTEVKVFEISVSEARTIAQAPVFSPRSRRATVASEPSVFGIGRLMQAYRQVADLQERGRVFYDRKEALKWLGLKDPSHPENPASAGAQ